MKLSEMMRYTIYEGDKNKVLIHEEIVYLKNYIDLHKIRYKKHVNIMFNHAVDPNITVAPLLFINLLENAFKHGVETIAENAFIKMNLRNDDHFIYFSIENNFKLTADQSSKGIGLKNLERRLALLYPNKHELKCDKQESIFKVNLKISI